MGYKNVFLCESVNDLSPIVYDGSIAVISDDLTSIYVVEGGVWAKKNVGVSQESFYLIDSVYSTVSEKDPADILGFGKWELVEKEPVFMWKRKE